MHRPVAGPGELRHQRALADDRQRLGPGAVGIEQLVLDAGHGRAEAAQHPAPDDGVRLGRRGLVEHRGRRRAPVDEQGVPVLVAQPDPADVARLGVELGTQVEAAEDQALVRGVELGDPLGGLEDHGVALDQATLVAEPAAFVALARQLLRGPGRAGQLHVHAVHEGLLLSHLVLDELF